jgi:hypothetical protein
MSIKVALSGEHVQDPDQEDREKVVLAPLPPPKELSIDTKDWSRINIQSLPEGSSTSERFYYTEEADKIVSPLILSLFLHQGEAKRDGLPPQLKGSMIIRPNCQPRVNNRRIIDHRRIHSASDKINPGVLGYLRGKVPNSHPEDLHTMTLTAYSIETTAKDVIDGASITSTEALQDMGYDLEGDPKAYKLELSHVKSDWSTLIEGSSLLDEMYSKLKIAESGDQGGDALVTFRVLLAALQDRYNGLASDSDWVMLLGKLLKHPMLKDSKDLLTTEAAAPQMIEDVRHLTYMLFSKVVQSKIAALQGSARLTATRCCALRYFPFTSFESLLTPQKTDQIPEKPNFESVSKQIPFRLILPYGGAGGFTDNTCSHLREVSKALQASACQPTDETLVHFFDSWVNHVYEGSVAARNLFDTDKNEILGIEGFEGPVHDMREMAVAFIINSKNKEVAKLVRDYDGGKEKDPKSSNLGVAVLKGSDTKLGVAVLKDSAKESGWIHVTGKRTLVPLRFLVQVMTYVRVNSGSGKGSNYTHFVRTNMVRSVSYIGVENDCFEDSH